MNKIILEANEIEEYSKLFEFKTVGKNGFFLTFYNGHLREFYKFLNYLIRKYFPNFDHFSNSEMFSIKYLVKHHGTQYGIYGGSWISGTPYLITLVTGYGVIGDEVLYIHTLSESDVVDAAMTKIHDTISEVKSVWGTTKLKETIFKELANICEL